MGRLHSLVDPPWTEQHPGPARAGVGLGFKAALYGPIKAKDCLCSGELRDAGPAWQQ